MMYWRSLSIISIVVLSSSVQSQVTRVNTLSAATVEVMKEEDKKEASVLEKSKTSIIWSAVSALTGNVIDISGKILYYISAYILGNILINTLVTIIVGKMFLILSFLASC